MPEVCVCGHPVDVHTGNGVTESACKGLRMGALGLGGCGCVGFTVEPRCDFCSSIPAPWTYPTRESTSRMEVQGGPEDGATVGPALVSHEGWAACERCAALIEKGDREALVQMLPIGDEKSSEMRVMIRSGVRQMHDLQFWNMRYGAGYRH